MTLGGKREKFLLTVLTLRSEHAKRSPNCAFLHMKKTFDKLTAIEYFQLEQERLRIYIVSVNAFAEYFLVCMYNK